MPIVDTQRYEMFNHMHPYILESGQRPEILNKAIAKEILRILIEPNFEIRPWTSRNILCLTSKRCSHIPFQGTYARRLMHLLI